MHVFASVSRAAFGPATIQFEDGGEKVTSTARMDAMNAGPGCCSEEIAEVLGARSRGKRPTRLSFFRQTVDEPCLARISGIRTLRFLEFSRSGLTDRHLARLEGLSGLRHLELIINQEITDEGLAHVGRLARLEVLSLAGDWRITDAGLAHLRALTRLRKLDLLRTGVTAAGLWHLDGEALEELDLPFAHTNCRLPDLVRNLRRFPRLRRLGFPPGPGWKDAPDEPIDARLGEIDSKSARWVKRAAPRDCVITMRIM